MMTNVELKATVQQLINEFAVDPDIVAIVGHIENSLATTKDHYGYYMRALTPYTNNKVAMYIFSRAFIRAGGNVNGVQLAVKLLTGTGE